MDHFCSFDVSKIIPKNMQKLPYTTFKPFLAYIHGFDLCYSWFYHTWWITLIWPSPIPLQTLWIPWSFFILLMFPRSSLKTCLNCYTWLLNPFSHIYAGLTPKTTYIGMCAKGQILLEFSSTWIRLTCLLAFLMPWDCLDSTLHCPIEEIYKEPFGYCWAPIH